MVFGSAEFPVGFVTILEQNDAGIWSTLGDLELPADASEGMFADNAAVLPRSAFEPSGFYFANLSGAQSLVENPTADIPGDGGEPQESNTDSGADAVDTDTGTDVDADTGTSVDTDTTVDTDAVAETDESNSTETDSVTDTVSSDSGGGAFAPGLFFSLTLFLFLRRLSGSEITINA